MKNFTTKPMTLAIASILMTNITHADTSVEDEAAPLEEVLVLGSYFNGYKADTSEGAMRMNMSALETPQSVNVIPEVVINEQLATTLGEVLSNDASISANSTARNREAFSLRGFQLSSGTGYLRDGHQHWSHYQQPIEILERVEVIKGPSSTLYGQSGPGGLVNMVSKTPTADAEYDFTIDVDQEGSTRAMIDLGGPVDTNGTVGYRFVLVDQNVNYSREYHNGEARERDRTLGSLVLDWQVGDSVLVRAHYDNTADKAGLDSGNWLDESGNVIGDDTKIRDLNWAFTDIHVKNAGVDIIVELSDNWNANLGFNRQDFDRQRFESSPRACGSSDDCAEGEYLHKPYDRHDDWLFSTAYLDVTGEFQTGALSHTVLVGANGLDYYYGQLRERGETIVSVPGQPSPQRPDLDYKNADSLYESEYKYYGIYAQDLISIGEHWQVLIGARNDWVDKDDELQDSNHFLPRLGLTYHPTENSSVYYSYSQSFEPGNAELVDETDINNGMALDPVQGKQSEIGAKVELFEDRLLITGALFDIDREGTLITEVIDHPEFETRTTQAGVQNHKGFEASASGSVTDRLFVLASTMYIDAEYEKDQRYQGFRPTDVPEWTSSLWTRYEFDHNVALNAGVSYVGDRFADSENQVVKDGYTRVDLGIVWSPVLRDTEFQVRLNVENVFDEYYLAGGGMTSTTVGEGRFFKMAFSASL